jgi:uncharacterized protein YcnI
MKHKLITKVALFSILALAFTLATPGLAFAHVVVTPDQALTGAYETFTTSVPNERDVAVTGLRIVIPDSIESVTPTVKPGWEITTKKIGDKITELTWTGGTIPAEQRDTFTFSAHLSDKSGDVNWKAYQTYQDGLTVSWDQKPADDGGHGSEDETKGPYSVTAVTDENSDTVQTGNTYSNIVPYVISITALALSVFVLLRTSKK